MNSETKIVVRRPRDTQRSRVYAWERSLNGASMHVGSLSLENVAAMVAKVWRAERGRYGLSNAPSPGVECGRGARRAFVRSSHSLVFPRWARNEWVVLHELAHRLTPHDAGHGPRFVACLIGLASRHMGRDVQLLIDSLAEFCVKVDLRSVGAIPARSMADKLFSLCPISMMDAAVELDCSYRKVQGWALVLSNQGRARWLRKKLTAIQHEPSPLQPAKVLIPRRLAIPVKQSLEKQVKALARLHDIDVDCDGDGELIWVDPPEGLFIREEDDPYNDEHYCDSWSCAMTRVLAYIDQKSVEMAV